MYGGLPTRLPATPVAYLRARENTFHRVSNKVERFLRTQALPSRGGKMKMKS